MSPRSDRLRTNEDRRLSTPTTTAPDSRLATVGRWLWTSGYQGLGQVALLSAPVLWLVFRSPQGAAFLKPTVLVLVVVTPLVVGAFREGHLSAGRPWPTITSSSLSATGGYWSIFRRAVLLNHVLGVAAYGGAAVGLLGASFGVGGTLTAALCGALVLACCGVAAVPWLTPETARATLGRLCLALTALGLAVAVGAPLSGDPRFRTAPAAFVLLVCLSVVDLRPWGRLAAIRSASVTHD
jgi:hypothetical protein